MEKEKTEDKEDGFGHIIKQGMKHLEGMFLERKFDSDNLYTIHKKPKSAFSFRESVVFPSVQLESILVARIHVFKLVFLSLIFVFFLSDQFIPATTTSVPVFYHLGIMI